MKESVEQLDDDQRRQLVDLLAMDALRIGDQMLEVLKARGLLSYNDEVRAARLAAAVREKFYPKGRA